MNFVQICTFMVDNKCCLFLGGNVGNHRNKYIGMSIPNWQNVCNIQDVLITAQIVNVVMIVQNIKDFIKRSQHGIVTSQSLIKIRGSYYHMGLMPFPVCAHVAIHQFLTLQGVSKLQIYLLHFNFNFLSVLIPACPLPPHQTNYQRNGRQHLEQKITID